MSRRLFWFVSMLSASAALMGGCGEHEAMGQPRTADQIIVERRPDPAYDQLFPHYVELCALSQFRSSEKGTGGVTGHAVMCLKGACRDERAPFPQLRRCRVVATDIHDPEHGVGVSVGRWFHEFFWLPTAMARC